MIKVKKGGAFLSLRKGGGMFKVKKWGGGTFKVDWINKDAGKYYIL